MKRGAFLLFAILSSSVLALAQTSGWKVDKNHTSIGFTVDHMVISEVSGNFKDYDLTVTSDEDDFTDATFEATIKVESINTDNANREKHLKSDDFFNAEKFPEMKFKSTSVEKVGEKNYKITGDLTIRDVTKKVTFDATLNGILKTQSGSIAAWKATATISRFDYNLKWNRTIETGGLVAGQDVIITIVAELRK